MKTLSALIFCISVILLVYLSGATNKPKRYIQTLTPIEIYETVECLETCAAKKIIAQVPANEKALVLARLKGQTRTVARIEYQEKAGWFTVTELNAEFLESEK